jgi:hypothetical protein
MLGILPHRKYYIITGNGLEDCGSTTKIDLEGVGSRVSSKTVIFLNFN